uniref:Uncharacterized protein n=1 Tax=Oryza brachyantha TaxID=4533 RepID=J3MCD0_ORYBR
MPWPWYHELPLSPLASRCSGLSLTDPRMPSAAAAAFLSPACFLGLLKVSALPLVLPVVVGCALAFFTGESGCFTGELLKIGSLFTTRPCSDELRNRRKSLLHPAFLEAGRVAKGSAFLGGEPLASLPPSGDGDGDGALVASRRAAANGSKSTPEPTLLRRRGDRMPPLAIGDRGDDATLPPSSSPGGGISG